MQDQLQNATITIAGVEDKGVQLKVKGSDGKTYSFFKKKQDGQNSVAYSQWKDMELEVGSTVAIGFKTASKTFDDGKTVEFRNIMSFREADGAPAPKAPVHSKTEPTAPVVVKPATTPQRSMHDDEFGWRLAIHGFVNGLLAGGMKPAEITRTTIAELLMLEDKIIMALQPNAEIPAAGVKTVSNPDVDMPPLESYDDGSVNVEDIPF